MARIGTNGYVDDGEFCDVGFGAGVGVGDGLFDHIEDLLDFPSDDVLGMGAVEPCNNQFSPPLLTPLPGNVGDVCLNASNNVGAGVGFGREEERNLGSCDELDMAQLEWMSNFFDESDSFSFDIPSSCNPVAAMITNDDDKKKNSNKDDDKNNNGGTGGNSKSKDDSSSLFRTPSPTSVLENSLSISGGSGSGSGGSFSSSYSSSSSSSSSEFYVGAFGNDDFNNAPPSMASRDGSPDGVLKLRVLGRPRSKRSRPAALWAQPQVAAPVLPPAFEPPSVVTSSDPESFGESCPPPMKKKKKKKTALPPAAAASGGGLDEEDSDDGPHQAVRKCMHCEITKTPQWRAGPMGPKTLCNACGVRYKSGRLFPEYRPAASPTFVPSVHSNSHKKVVEMRLKSTPSSTGQQKGAGGLLSSCDLLEYIRRR